MISPGDVVLTRFPLTSGYEAKVRPSLVVACETDADDPLITVAAITSSEQRGDDRGVLVIADYAGAGLDRPSIVQVRKLFTTQKSKLGPIVGRIDVASTQRIRRMLGDYFGEIAE